jgi:hypothetical protein
VHEVAQAELDPLKARVTGKGAARVGFIVDLVLLVDEVEDGVDLVDEPFDFARDLLVVLPDLEHEGLARARLLEVDVHSLQEILDLVAVGLDLEPVDLDERVLRVVVVVDIKVVLAVEKVEVGELDPIVLAIVLGGHDEAPRIVGIGAVLDHRCVERKVGL